MANDMKDPVVDAQNGARSLFSSHTKSASDACTDYLRSQIVSGALENNTALVIDRIAADLGISHTPVREAVRRLEAEGLVTYEPRRGVKVRGLNPSEFEELLNLRKSIEPIALAKAISIAEPGAFAEAEENLQLWTKAVGSTEMLRRQRKFLRAMYLPSGLTRTMEVIEANLRLIERYHQHSWQTSEKTRVKDLKLKKRILTTCRARKEKEAIEALIVAIDWGAELAREGLK